MKKISILVGLLMVSLWTQAQQQFFVTPKGKGESYKTIYESLKAAEGVIQKSGYPSEGIEVIVESGYYKIDKTITISKSLSGTFSKPLVIKAAYGADVHFFGGEILNFKDFKAFNPQTAGFKLSDKSATNHIKVYDLKANGIKKSALGEFFKHGYGFEFNPNFTTPAMLWVDGERMNLSRWPNLDELNPYYDNVNQFKGRFNDVEIKGAVSLVDVTDEGMKKQNMWFKNNEFLENGGGTFTVAFDRASSWDYYNTSSEKVWLDGVLSASWEWEYTKVKSINGRSITLASGPNRKLGYFRKVTHFHFENVPEELDSEGEYFIDRDNMLLYFYPPSTIGKKTITLSTLEGNMFELVGASHVKIEGLVLESGMGNGIIVENEKQWKKIIKQSFNVQISNCTIRNFNQWGVLIQGPKQSKVDGCHIYNLGAGGVKLGNDFKEFSLDRENNVVSNCEIHHIAFDQKSQVPGITLAGCGNTAKNNEIYNTPHFAIKMKFANDCVAEKNYMHDLPEYHHFDGGALYLATGGQFFNRGNVVKQNYFENIATNGAYLDNYTMGNYVFGNIFNNVGNSTKGSKNAAVYIHGGGQNVIQNNVAINCPYAYKTGSHIVKAPNTTNYLFNWYKDAREYFQPNSEYYNMYVEKYPELKTFLYRLHNSPKEIISHSESNTLKQISNSKNRKTQLDVYDLKGAKAHTTINQINTAWDNWFRIRYQSSKFANNIYAFSSDKHLPDLSKAKMFYKLGGESGVFEMSPFNLREDGKLKRLTNHKIVGNANWQNQDNSLIFETDINGEIKIKETVDLSSNLEFIPIEFSKIGRNK